MKVWCFEYLNVLLKSIILIVIVPTKIIVMILVIAVDVANFVHYIYFYTLYLVA